MPIITASVRVGIEVSALAADFRLTTKDGKEFRFGTMVFRHCESKKLFIFQTEEITERFKKKQLTREELCNALVAALPFVMRRVYRDAYFFNRRRPLKSEDCLKAEVLNSRISELEARFKVRKRVDNRPAVTFAFAAR